MAAAVPWPLRQSKEVIHKDINMLKELGVLSAKVRVPRQGTKLFVETWSRFDPNSLSTIVQLVRQRWRMCAQSLLRDRTFFRSPLSLESRGGETFSRA